ncbi:MAG TPA: permease [Candidatus Omnitrophota bacterium]|nr:permease [Candidatus Omnitrophota bacterium]HRZ14393.1 permease [Candidatus Omnitrophota bacterium]
MPDMIRNILEFFLALSVLFLVIAFVCHYCLRWIAVDRMALVLQRKWFGLGNLAAALIGAVTPFCVCTTIPFFTGILQAGVSTHIAVSFLLASPLVSISGAALIAYLFGFKFTLVYIATVVLFSVLGGMLVRWLGMEGEIAPSIGKPPAQTGTSVRSSAGFAARLFKSLFIPLLAGALIAGVIHNYIPVQFVQSLNRYPVWMTIPAAALIGFPLYSNIAVLAPISFSLVEKGLHPGVVMTFIMSGGGMSFPTALVLHKLLKARLFGYYLIYTFVFYCVSGFIFCLVR